MVASIAYIQHSVLRPWSFTGVVFYSAIDNEFYVWLAIVVFAVASR